MSDLRTQEGRQHELGGVSHFTGSVWENAKCETIADTIRQIHEGLSYSVTLLEQLEALEEQTE